jgi:hypothetical protein
VFSTLLAVACSSLPQVTTPSVTPRIAFKFAPQDQTP